MKLIGIGYCGKKPEQSDHNVCGTGLVWVKDENTVHFVTEEQAAKFLYYTDSWCKAGEKEVGDTKVEPVKTTKKPEELFANVNLENMTKAALIDYAKRNFNADLKPEHKVATLRNEVKHLQKNHTAADE